MPGAARSTWIAVAGGAVLVSALLVGLSVLTYAVAYRMQLADPGSPPLPALAWVDVNTERNIPTAWSAALLLVSASGAARLAARRTDAADSAWWLVAAVACLLGVDEWLSLHERLGGVGAALVGDALHFAWVVPGAGVAAVVGAVLVRRLRDQPDAVRHQLTVAGVIYLSGALALETLAGFVLRDHGHAAGYLLVTGAEELLEMVGAALLLATVAASSRRSGASGTTATEAARPGRHARADYAHAP